jgi:hypothetical protein
MPASPVLAAPDLQAAERVAERTTRHVPDTACARETEGRELSMTTRVSCSFGRGDTSAGQTKDRTEVPEKTVASKVAQPGPRPYGWRLVIVVSDDECDG